MNWIIRVIIAAGDYLISLSDSTKKQIVFLLLVLLGGAGIYKLVVSLHHMSRPQPAVSVDQLIKPMEKLFQQTNGRLNAIQQKQRRDKHQLDSLSKAYTDLNQVSR